MKAVSKLLKRSMLNSFGNNQRFCTAISVPERSRGLKLALGGAAAASIAAGLVLALEENNASKADSVNRGMSTDLFMQNIRDERHESRMRDLRVFAGTANIPLAQEISKVLNLDLGDIQIHNFADGEIGIQVQENVRGKDIYIVQPTCPPGVNDNMLELILLISTMRRASARTITAVLPYYGYARQDRKMTSRVPISAADVAKLLEAMGVDRVVALDLHCGQIQGFFGPRTPCDNLNGSVVALSYFANLGLNPEKTVIVSPDAGGVYRAKNFRDGLKRQGLDCGLAMIVKQRERANSIAKMDLVGDVTGCDCIIVDDMIDTGGTLCKAGRELKTRGANRVFAFATHGLFSGPAIERIRMSDFEKVVVTNSIPLEPKKRIDKIAVISVASLLAGSIFKIHFRESLSKLFDDPTLGVEAVCTATAE